MKRYALLSICALTLLVASARPGQAANVPYFPYDTIEDYYKGPPGQPAAGEPPAGQPSGPQLEESRRAGQPVAVKVAPDFLFPEQLGFGVAVGVPYDMMYLAQGYYYWQGGVWYRGPSFRGPWTELGISQLPPELRKQTLARIRELRNREFRAYWKNKEKYQGKRFRPGEFKEQ